MVRSGRLVGVLVGLVGLVGAPLAVIVLLSSPAGGITLTPLTVDNSGDGAPVATNCAPVPVADQCTLRDAVAAANLGGADASIDVVINIPASVGTITLIDGLVEYDGGASGTQTLTLNGNGNTIDQTTSGAGVLFSTAPLSISGLTITGGNGATGSGVDNDTTLTVTDSTITANTNTGNGGGIFADGPVILRNSTISNNTAVVGGGIFAQENGTTVTVINSTISDNHSTATSGDGGGGLESSEPVTVTNSTITGNTADNEGGGTDTTTGAPVTMKDSTITGNTADDEGGGIYAQGGPVTLDYVTDTNNSAPTGANIAPGEFTTDLTSFGSVIANPLGGGTDCSGTTSTSTGFNWDQDGSCGFAAAGDHSNAGDPGLSGLASNGGSTQTLLPQSGSGLIDAIPVASCQADGALGITTDQRGVTRPQGAGCDIGAVEVQVTAAIPAVTAAFTG